MNEPGKCYTKERIFPRYKSGETNVKLDSNKFLLPREAALLRDRSTMHRSVGVQQVQSPLPAANDRRGRRSNNTCTVRNICMYVRVRGRGHE